MDYNKRRALPFDLSIIIVDDIIEGSLKDPVNMVITRSFQGAKRGFFQDWNWLLKNVFFFLMIFFTFCVYEGRINFQPQWIRQGG